MSAHRKEAVAARAAPPKRVEADKPFVGPEDLAGFDPATMLGEPGSFPYTRGPHRTMYRERLWTMRQFAGFGAADDTNRRFKYLLEKGQTGLSTAFDLPTLMGRDSDDPLSLGEVGRCGVAIASLADMRRLFDGINLGEVSTSMTINAPAAILLAFYICVAQEEGVPLNNLRGTLQNDILKEFHAQNEYVFPPRPSVKLVIDTIEYCTRQMPQWNTVSISGYHIREAGATAAEELAFTLADGLTYAEESIKRGLDVEAFAQRLSFFFDVHNDFFEEIAKLRAARRIWAHVARERLKARQERSWLLRTHCQTAGVTLTEQQPENNLIRVAYQAMAGVLGGTQSLHTNSMDETLALPSEHAAKLALRTQQILAHETNVTQSVDPLAGSYFVEKLTNEIEAKAKAILDQIDAMGGVLAAIDRGYFRRAIAESALAQQRAMDAGRLKVVGVTDFVEEGAPNIPILIISQETENQQVARLKELKRRRDAKRHQAALERIREDARADRNMMPALIAGAQADATVGEMMDAMKSVFGAYDGGPEW
ncbi:MAG TPA: methylmalonyl-CoA mutase family protein [Phycisphaerae bacterium]|nr:methylmalonyl-CoA mutase family protein [Phycisphaerae bacterium]HNU45956.1 methylmalonyl-CoA mutase family protein [Phycisphaerae bacterium]